MDHVDPSEGEHNKTTPTQDNTNSDKTEKQGSSLLHSHTGDITTPNPWSEARDDAKTAAGVAHSTSGVGNLDSSSEKLPLSLSLSLSQSVIHKEGEGEEEERIDQGIRLPRYSYLV